MRMRSVISDSLRAVGYNSLTRTLAIRFEDGSLYHYLSVPFKVHEQLMKAKSKGAFFAEHIRNSYKHREVT